MKHALAAVVLLTALTVLVKVVGRPSGGAAREVLTSAPVAVGAQASTEAALVARYPNERDLVERAVERYRRTAVEVEAREGLRGLRLLDRLDLEAIFLFEKHPDEFRRLAALVSDDAAADLLLHWKEYFGLKRSDDVDRERLIGDIARLPASRRRLVSQYPAVLPLLLADPEEVGRWMERWADQPKRLEEQLVVLDLVSLEGGAADIRRALGVLERDRERALDAFRQFGPEGFALAALYGPVLEAVGDGLSLEEALILLRVNTDDVDGMLSSQTPEMVAGHLRHVAAVGLAEAAGSSAHGLRLSAEYGDAGDRALEQAGGDAADLVYEMPDDALLRQRAIEALGEYGSMAAAMLAKYGIDADFQAILRRDGAAIIPPIARSDVAPEVLLMLQQKERKGFTENLAQQIMGVSGESGQATIRMIRSDGLARVAEVNRTDVPFYQFLPLYDLLHLAGVMARGHGPTGGEMAWALVDGCFVVADVLSLVTVQPGGAVASEAARKEVKAVAQVAARRAGIEMTEQTADAAGRVARWWAVRSAGGTFAVMKRVPEALGRISFEHVTRMAGPMCRKAGLRLSAWTPLRFVRDGQAVLMRIPPGVWAKYVGVNVVQAGVGVVAMHKMEEYMTSRRSNSAQ